MEDTEENFIDYLGLKQLSDMTIKVYLRSYRNLKEFLTTTNIPLDQDVVNAFLIRYKSNTHRAFLLNYFDFIGRNDLKIIKITGSKGIRKIKKIKTIPVEYLRRVLVWLYERKPKYALMIELIYQCALRRGEVVKIKAGDFMWADRFEEELDAPLRLLVHGKYTRERYVYVPRLLAEAIREFVKLNNLEAEHRIFPIGSDFLSQVFRDACRNSIGRSYNLHSLRHTKSTEWYSQGVDIFQIQRRLGHASISTTEVYINPDEKVALDNWKRQIMKDSTKQNN